MATFSVAGAPTRVAVRCGESRIGKVPVAVPKGVDVTLSGSTLTVKGKTATLTREFPDGVVLSQEEDNIIVKRADDSRKARSQHGLCRTLANNMVVGVSEGWKKELELVGVGYRASVEGRTLVMNLGYSHPVRMEPPEGVTAAVEGNTKVTISGADKEVVGNFAAVCRSKRPPEPYKGKGVKYVDEVIERKEGKSGR
eukprot:PRCOL_00003594-RA